MKRRLIQNLTQPKISNSWGICMYVVVLLLDLVTRGEGPLASTTLFISGLIMISLIGLVWVLIALLSVSLIRSQSELLSTTLSTSLSISITGDKDLVELSISITPSNVGWRLTNRLFLLYYEQVTRHFWCNFFFTYDMVIRNDIQ